MPSRPARTSGGAVRTPARVAFDRLRTGHEPDAVERELRATGVEAAEARRHVDAAIEGLYRRNLGRAQRDMAIGGVALLIGLGVTVATLASSMRVGGVGFVMYGMIGVGLVEFLKGWNSMPKRPPPRDGPPRRDAPRRERS